LILPYRGRWPKIHETAFVAPSADIIGDVEIGAHCSIWFQVVIRGDVHRIRIGKNTNIQDHAMLHVNRKNAPLVIGDEVTVGHRVALHGCTVGDRVLVGIGAVILDHAEIAEECIVGASALVPKGMKIPSRSLVMGVPARIVRSLSDEEISFLSESAQNYVADGIEYYGVMQGPKKMGSHHIDVHLYAQNSADEDY
jgi:carbonic anhydrase/acetyltransferase-like protein (isoleucine patch superfamily)